MENKLEILNDLLKMKKWLLKIQLRVVCERKYSRGQGNKEATDLNHLRGSDFETLFLSRHKIIQLNYPRKKMCRTLSNDLMKNKKGENPTFERNLTPSSHQVNH